MGLLRHAHHPVGAGLIVFAVIPLFILFTTLCRKRMMRASTEVKAKLAGINGEVESSISGMRTAKAFANEAAESAKFDQANDQFRGASGATTGPWPSISRVWSSSWASCPW